MSANEPKPRAPRYGGGLCKLSRTRIDRRTGETVEYNFWQASREVSPEHLPQGVARKRITGNGQTPAMAKQRLEQNYNLYISPENQARASMRGLRRITLSDLFDEWIRYRGALDLSPTMVVKYQSYFRLHILPELGTKPVGALTKRDLASHFGGTLVAKRRTNKDGTDGGQLLSGAAIRNIFMALSGCLKYGVENGYLQYSPLATLKKPKRYIPTDDYEQIAKNARTLLRRLEEDEHPDYCRWALQFLGLRKSERLGLTWRQITNLESETPSIVIDQQLARREKHERALVQGRVPEEELIWYLKPRTKGGEPRRFVIPRQPFAELLREHKRRQDAQREEMGRKWKATGAFRNLVFLDAEGRLITPNKDNDDWHALLRRYDLPPWRAHANRHITAVMLAEMRPPVPIAYVRELLGHSSDALSWYYTHLSQENLGQYLNEYGDHLAAEIGRNPNASRSRSFGS